MVQARWSLLIAFTMVSVLGTQVMATHMGTYMTNPVERDDQGRSFEPDFATTGVLGRSVVNCVVDTTPIDPGCIPDGALPPTPSGQASVLAPGCTDDSGRRPSGLCGLFTVGVGNGNTGNLVPPGVAGTTGMTAPRAPGRFTSSTGSIVRFLDTQTNFQFVPPAGGSAYIEINAKLADSGASAILGSLDGDFGGRALAPGGTAIWTWYGTWQDKNGNGVIDMEASDDCNGSSCGAQGGVMPTNEFVWRGKCIQFNGQEAPTGQKFCVKDAGTVMPLWMYPGGHHAYCGFGVAPTCGVAPADFPGRQLFNVFVVGETDPDQTADDFTGDTLFDDQTSVAMDQLVGDRTGDFLITGRHWVFGNGWATFFWDQSILTTTTFVTGVTTAAADSGNKNTYDLTKLTSTDVDTYKTFSPEAETLLVGTVKPALRSNWVFVRDAYLNGLEAADVYRGTRLTYDECDPNLGVCLGTNSAALQGGLDDRLFDPGWAKEPNTASDVHPGAVRGVCASAFATLQGFCSDYSGYSTQYRGWIEMQQFPGYYQNLAWRTPFGQCVTCVTGGPSGLPDLGPGYVRPDGDFARVLNPGSHIFTGIVGAWKDRMQVHKEVTLDLLATVSSLGPVFKQYNYAVGPDAWIGDIVNNTGASRASGFAPESCTINGVTAVREWAQCHPYRDGLRSDSNSYNNDEATGGEFENAQIGENGANQWVLILRPAGGTWTVPTFVWRAFDTWTMGDTSAIQDYTGRSEPILLPMGLGPGLINRDLLILPQGNMGLTVTSEIGGVVKATDLTKGVNVLEFVRDVDVYRPYAG